jgi:anti-sigma B factor antagonist
MQTPFDVRVTQVNRIPVVSVSGELDLTTGVQLRTAIDRLVSPDQPTVVVDLDGTTFLGSTGVGMLLAAHKLCRGAGGVLRVVTSDPKIREVFVVTNVESILPLYRTLDDAVNGGSP